jgi:hypothetical protein
MSDKEKALVETIASLEDYDGAAGALTELKYENSDKALKMAAEIVEQEKGDVYLQASAFGILYSIDQTEGFRFIREKSSEIDPIVLGSMLECVTEDSSLIEGNTELLEIVKKLNLRADKLSNEDRDRIADSLSWFKESYAELI